MKNKKRQIKFENETSKKLSKIVNQEIMFKDIDKTQIKGIGFKTRNDMYNHKGKERPYNYRIFFLNLEYIKRNIEPVNPNNKKSHFIISYESSFAINEDTSLKPFDVLTVLSLGTINFFRKRYENKSLYSRYIHYSIPKRELKIESSTKVIPLYEKDYQEIKDEIELADIGWETIHLPLINNIIIEK